MTTHGPFLQTPCQTRLDDTLATYREFLTVVLDERLRSPGLVIWALPAAAPGETGLTISQQRAETPEKVRRSGSAEGG